METIDLIQNFIDNFAAQAAWKFYLLGFFAAVLLLLVLWDIVREPSQMLAFSTERGKVFLSRRAISEMISKVAARTYGVAKCKSSLKRRRGKLYITLKLHVRADADLREIERKLEVQIVDVLNRNLGFNSLGSFTMRAMSVVGDLADVHTAVTRQQKTGSELSPRSPDERQAERPGAIGA
ncbi:MAG TPA: hypothetical protein PKI32_06975 [Opitutales bacterium]|nr:hypothetical protein [Opitutales bacterium]